MIIIKYLLYPFSFLYGLLMLLRRFLYKVNFLKRHEFDIPIISVGNITIGGTGKTPHVEYLINLLSDKHRIATLSRGYKRKSKGFIHATKNETAQTIGDEPTQYLLRYGDEISIVVCENRVYGIQRIMEFDQKVDIILLDDAFQHLAVKPGLQIILSDFYHMIYDDFVLPSGRLREFKSAISEADIIIITKCPIVVSPLEIKTISDKLQLLETQKLMFSHLKYGDWVPITEAAKNYEFTKKTSNILLVTGIANSYPLFEHVREKCSEIKEIKFSDHQNYTDKHLTLIQKEFDFLMSKNKIIITTEKDAMRLSCIENQKALHLLPIFYVPIHVEFQEPYGEIFNEQIINYVNKNSRN